MKAEHAKAQTRSKPLVAVSIAVIMTMTFAFAMPAAAITTSGAANGGQGADQNQAPNNQDRNQNQFQNQAPDNQVQGDQGDRGSTGSQGIDTVSGATLGNGSGANTDSGTTAGNGSAAAPSTGGNAANGAPGQQNPPTMNGDPRTEAVRTAIDALEDGETKTELTTLIDTYDAAVEALQNATSTDNVDSLMAAVATAKTALDEAIEAAGIDIPAPEAPDNGAPDNGNGNAAAPGAGNGDKGFFDQIGDGFGGFFNRIGGMFDDLMHGHLPDFSGNDNQNNQNGQSGQPGNTDQNGQSGQPGGQNSGTANTGTGTNTYTKDTTASDGTYTSATADDNAVRAESGADVSLTNATITKTGNSTSSGDSDFYGLNSGVLALAGSTITLDGSTVTTNASGSNAVFAYGTGSSVIISDTTVSTSENNSGGIEVSGGGSITATDLTVTTQGASSAAIRSDRGGGTITATGGTYTTNGTGSPAIYCTANIAVLNAVLKATSSEALVIEGSNSITLTDCTVSGNMTGTYGKNSSENLQAIMIYQSTSGDAQVGTARLSVTGGSLTANSGDTIYVTNTDCTIYLSGVAIANSADGNLLTVAGNDGSRGWGTAGSNGGTCELTADGQILAGSIVVDSISSLDLQLENASAYTGAINTTGAAGDVAVTLDATSTWTLTGDAYITSFSGDVSSIVANGYHVYVNGVAIV